MSSVSRERPVVHHLLVMAQLTGVVLAIVPPINGQQSGFGWLSVAGLGIALGMTTLCFNRIGNFSIYPTPHPSAQLITNGPYRLVRHPMYVSLALMMVGIAGYNQGVRHALAALSVIAVVIAKAGIEERLMSARYPEYDAYCRRTRRFIPYLY